PDVPELIPFPTRRSSDLDARTNILHGVVDRHAARHHAARRVDVHPDVLLRILRFEEQELRHDERSHVILDLASHEDDPLAQKARDRKSTRLNSSHVKISY